MIRRLKSRHIGALKKHFEALSQDDLRLRFNMSCNPVWVVENYVGKLDFQRDILLGVFEGDDLVAFCHGAVVNQSVELGLSVLSSHRGKGFGSVLIERVKAFAAAQGANDVYVMCASDNTAMLTLARRHAMKMSSIGGESEGHVDPSSISGEAFAGAAADELVADVADIGVDSISIPLSLASKVQTQLTEIYLDTQKRASKIFFVGA